MVDSICIGSGRFLRAVLVPALVAAGYHPAIISPRSSRSFLESLLEQQQQQQEEEDREGSRTYEIDTVRFDGGIETTRVPCWGAGTLGSPEGKQDVLELCAKLPCDGNASKPLILGLGVTEAGLSSSSTTAMKDLYDVLAALSKRKRTQTQTDTDKDKDTKPPQPIHVINTDNVAKNGTVLRGYMNELAARNTHDDSEMERFLVDSVVFHNTMVDRITSQRPGSRGLVPRAEPTPLKALVIEDLASQLPEAVRAETLRSRFGVVVRSHEGKLDADIALKLRVANGTHTAIAHAMALSGLPMTDVLSLSETKTKTETETNPTARLLVAYLDSFFDHQICRGVEVTTEFAAEGPGEARAVYDDWRQRLRHAHFGLSTFFITQNGAAKGGIRIGPTVRDLVRNDVPIECSTAFALAAILRFLTPSKKKPSTAPSKGIYRGWLDCGGEGKNGNGNSNSNSNSDDSSETTTVSYADGLSYDLKEGWYEFRCDCCVTVNGSGNDNGNGNGNGNDLPLPEALAALAANNGAIQPFSCEAVVAAYLKQTSGGDLSAVAHTDSFATLVKAVSTLYARMVAGDPAMEVLKSLDLEASCEGLVDGE